MNQKQYLAIDIGGTSVKLGVVDETGAVLAKAEESGSFDGYETPILTTVLKAAKTFVNAQGLSPASFVGVGVSATGQIDSRAGTVVGTCGNVPHYIGSPIKAELEALFGLPVTVANDANCMCLGDVLVGGAKGYTDVIGVTLGTGVGGGVIIDGKIYSGFNYAGAELGHAVIEYTGWQCSCGRKGCFEVYSSATGLIRMTKEALAEHPDSMMKEEEHISGRTAFNYMRKGDAAAKEVVDKYIKYLAAGITNTLNIFQPDVLCIGGGVCNEGDPLLLPMMEIVARENYPRNTKKNAEIVIAKLCNDAGIIGAAFLGNAQ